MPRKLKRAKRRVDVLNDNQRVQLESGFYFFTSPDEPEFDDEEHRRAAWKRHRDVILAEWDRVGQRPRAMWDYEGGWPEGAVSEAHAVWLLPDTSAAERAAIERDWLQSIRVALSSAWAAGDDTFGRAHPSYWKGVPSEFFDEHAPRIAAEQEADRRAYYRGLRRGGDVA